MGAQNESGRYMCIRDRVCGHHVLHTGAVTNLGSVDSAGRSPLISRPPHFLPVPPGGQMRHDLWDHNDVLHELQLWDLDCLLHDLHLENLHDQHNKDIDHLINDLQLVTLQSLLNSLDHGDLPLRHDRDVDDLDDELQLRNLRERVRPLQLFSFCLHDSPRRRLNELSPTKCPSIADLTNYQPTKCPSVPSSCAQQSVGTRCNSTLLAKETWREQYFSAMENFSVDGDDVPVWELTPLNWGCLRALGTR